MRGKLRINDWMIIPVMAAVWLVALLYQAGIGTVYGVYDKAKLLVYALVLYEIVWTKRWRKINRTSFLLILAILMICLYTSYLYGHHILDYIWLYFLIPLIGKMKIQEVPLRMVAILYGILGMVVLFLYNYGTVFSGWNTNSIAMLAFFSSAVMIMAFNETRNLRVLFFLLLYFVVYYQWTEALNSRSGLLFTIIMLAGVLGWIPLRGWLSNKKTIFFLLLFPLLVAILLCLVKNAGFVSKLEVWSYATFNKPIFNGRDELCYKGFMTWIKHPIIGNGNLSANNWHNSAVTMLVGAGIVGIALWVGCTYKVLIRGLQYLEDQYVLGLMIGFMAIWLQQTVELGLVAGQANAIPYAMLGLLVGRVRTIERMKRDEGLCHSSGV